MSRTTGILAGALVIGLAWAVTTKLRERRRIQTYPAIPKPIRRQGRRLNGRTKGPSR